MRGAVKVKSFQMDEDGFSFLIRTHLFSIYNLNTVQGGGGLMQQLKRSYSLTDLGEHQQFDQHRFTDVTEEEEGVIFLMSSSYPSSILFHLFYSISSHVQSNSDMQSVRFQVVVNK